MPIVDRPVEDEPEERPDQLGRALIRIRREYPDQWREVYETSNRSTAVRIEGCLIGRGEGRIAGAADIDHWEARMVERVEEEQTVYAVRVKWHTEPHGKDWRTKPKAPKKAEPEAIVGGPLVDVSDAVEHPETARLGGAKARAQAPRDPEEAAQAGLDMAAG